MEDIKSLKMQNKNMVLTKKMQRDISPLTIYHSPFTLHTSHFTLCLRAFVVCNFLTFLAILNGCGTAPPKQYIKSGANFQYIKKVAVLPFNNLTDDRYASEKVKSIVIMDILESGVFEVAEEGEVNKAVADVFREMGFREGELVVMDTESIKRIYEKLGVQALFIGSVESYGQSRGGSPYAVASISIKLVESNSGITLWRGVYSEKGSSVARTILGMEQKNEIELSRNVSKRLLSTLFGR